MPRAAEARRALLLSALRRAGRALLALPRALRWLACAAWMGLIWFLSAQTFHTPRGPGGLWILVGNLTHAPLFGVLALLLSVAFLAPAPAGWPRIGLREGGAVLAATCAWAALDETHQARVPGRHASLLDLATDAVGALCVLWIAAYLGREVAEERGLRVRLFAGLLACVASAALACAVA